MKKLLIILNLILFCFNFPLFGSFFLFNLPGCRTPEYPKGPDFFSSLPEELIVRIGCSKEKDLQANFFPLLLTSKKIKKSLQNYISPKMFKTWYCQQIRKRNIYVPKEGILSKNLLLYAVKNGHVFAVEQVLKLCSIDDLLGVKKAEMWLAVRPLSSYFVALHDVAHGVKYNTQEKLSPKTCSRIVHVLFRKIKSAKSDTPIVNLSCSLTTWTALHVGCHCENIAVVDALLKHPEIEVDKPDKDGDIPIDLAIDHGNLRLIKLFYKEKFYSLEQYWNTLNSTILKTSIEKNKFELFKWFMEQYRKKYFDSTEIILTLIPGNIKKNYKDFPLIYAAKKGHIAEVKKLASSRYIDRDQKDGNGRTAMMWAGIKGNLEVLKEVWSYQSWQEKDLIFGWSVGNLAAYYGHSNIIEHLHNTFKWLPVTRKQCWTTLHIAAAFGKLKVVETILDKLETVDPLIKKDRLNKVDQWGYTPLMLAGLFGHFDVAQLLLKAQHKQASSRCIIS